MAASWRERMVGKAMAGILLCAMAVGALAQAPRGPKLTEQQITEVRQLVRRTRAEVERLETAMDQRRQQLAQAYMRYELRARAVLDLQAEIVRMEQDLLAVHHRMHTRLRAIVTKEQFEAMKTRVGAMIGDGAGKRRGQGGK